MALKACGGGRHEMKIVVFWREQDNCYIAHSSAFRNLTARADSSGRALYEYCLALGYELDPIAWGDADSGVLRFDPCSALCVLCAEAADK